MVEIEFAYPKSVKGMKKKKKKKKKKRVRREKPNFGAERNELGASYCIF